MVRLRSSILVLFLGGCATGPTPAPEPPPTGTSAGTATTTASALPVATANAAPTASSSAAPGGAEPCPLFCQRVADACLRPDLPKPPDSCGAYSSEQAGRTRGVFPAPSLPCPERCCPGTATGPDPDADGLAGAADGCPDEPEDVDGFEDHDGCPDADNDGDGLADYQDRCCYVAEDKDGEQDEDGCPEP